MKERVCVCVCTRIGNSALNPKPNPCFFFFKRTHRLSSIKTAIVEAEAAHREFSAKLVREAHRSNLNPKPYTLHPKPYTLHCKPHSEFSAKLVRATHRCCRVEG